MFSKKGTSKSDCSVLATAWRKNKYGSWSLFLYTIDLNFTSPLKIIWVYYRPFPIPVDKTTPSDSKQATRIQSGLLVHHSDLVIVKSWENMLWRCVKICSSCCLLFQIKAHLKEGVTVSIEQAHSDYSIYENVCIDLDGFGHVIEIYDFPAMFKTDDLLDAFTEYRCEQKPFELLHCHVSLLSLVLHCQLTFSVALAEALF